MARHTFRLPDVGEGTTEAEITKWHVRVGDTIAEDAPLVDVATDKAVVEIPSPFAGVIVSIHGEEGDSVPVGTGLVVYETAAGAGAAMTPAAAPAAATGAPPDARTPPAGGPDASTATADKPLASPAVRRRARELGVALAALRGTGPGGRIMHHDLDAAAGTATAQAAPTTAAAPPDGAVEEIKVIGIRRRIAEQMQTAKRHIPHFSYVEEVDMSALVSLRNHLNERHGATRPRLSLLPFVIRALARTLPSHPALNARYDDDQGVLRRYRDLHVGIATQTPNGLLVPVLRHAQALGLWDCARAIADLAGRARAGKATREELAGSTLTLTSLGAMGGIAFTPIINYPEVAIVGLNKLVERPVAVQGRVEVRTLMNLSSSFDHRVVDGWDAAAFIQALRARLEQPATLFIDD